MAKGLPSVGEQDGYTPFTLGAAILFIGLAAGVVLVVLAVLAERRSSLTETGLPMP